MNTPITMGNSLFRGHFYPQGGFVSLDPNFYPGQVTLDAGPAYQAFAGAESLHQHHHEHHCHHHDHHHQCGCSCPPPAPCPVTYVVKKGDSVYKIAQKFNVTMQAIILANNLTNPDLIFPGQVLIIPGV